MAASFPIALLTIFTLPFLSKDTMGLRLSIFARNHFGLPIRPPFTK